ncbi:MULTISPECIES: hypothetical protein [unclassified Chelatococcus]|nr:MULTISPECIES: hypothetical protein [unclassified Chelatococcus]
MTNQLDRLARSARILLWMQVIWTAVFYALLIGGVIALVVAS